MIRHRCAENQNSKIRREITVGDFDLSRKYYMRQCHCKWWGLLFSNINRNMTGTMLVFKRMKFNWLSHASTMWRRRGLCAFWYFEASLSTIIVSMHKFIKFLIAKSIWFYSAPPPLPPHRKHELSNLSAFHRLNINFIEMCSSISRCSSISIRCK